MRIALAIIIFLLGSIIKELKIMPNLVIGILSNIGWVGLLHDYIQSKKK